MLTNDQLFRAVELLRDLVSISPDTGPDEYGPGCCHYCGEPIKSRKLDSIPHGPYNGHYERTIVHVEECYWKAASDFLDTLPDEGEES